MALSTEATVRFAVSLILSVVGTLGNVCALVVVTKSPALRKRSNAFLVNLSFVDFLVTAVVMPMFLAQTYYQSWPSTYGSCQAFTYLFIACPGNSFLTALLFTLYCYVKITKSSVLFERLFSGYKVLVYLLCIWICSITFTILAELISAKIKYVDVYMYCFYEPHDHKSWVYFAVFSGIGGIVILAVPLAYNHIYRSVRCARQRIHAAPPADQQNTTQHGPCSRSVHSKEELRITKVALLVSCEVIITCLPGCINLMLQQAIPAAVPAWRYISILLLVKSAINRYLYGWINKHYMNAYRKVFAPCFRNSQPSENSDCVDNINNRSNDKVSETKQSS
ncbi:melatonin receptor type 1B-A-like [Diadema setosum]|uniref:melatonin receptor type 1B-A-like n=1 Tax=Diadema setosum TaxID=31175 RepID=UPI003B3AB088